MHDRAVTAQHPCNVTFRCALFGTADDVAMLVYIVSIEVKTRESDREKDGKCFVL